MDFFRCKIATKDGAVHEDNSFRKEDVTMVIYSSVIGNLSHKIITTDCEFIKKFRRVAMKVGTSGSSSSEILHCVITNKYRFYLKDKTGETFITPKDYDMYL